MKKEFENGYGKKVLFFILCVFTALLFTSLGFRIFFYLHDVQVLYLDFSIGFSAYFIWDLGKAIAWSKKYKMNDTPLPPFNKKDKKYEN